MAAKTYIVYNGAMVTTAAPVKVATGATIKTLLQLKPLVPIRPIAWGISFDASAAATPGVVELVETDVAATVTAFVDADVQKYGDPNGPANASASVGPLSVGVSASGFTSSAEGTITATRMADLQQVDPIYQYSQQWPLGREFEVGVAKFLRVRVTFPVGVNALTWVIFEV